MTTHYDLTLLNIPGEAKILLECFNKIVFGKITITTPEKMKIFYPGQLNGPEVELVLYDWKVLTEVFNKSDIGLAETYILNQWDVSSIENFIQLAILNEEAFSTAFKGNIAKIIFYRLKHESRLNTKTGSKKNIQAHYDLGNNFYTLWLDPTMTYSSAYYGSNNTMSFSEAQLNKYKNILNMVNPKSSDHLLEIGCGWGGFLEFAGKKNMKITGITISKEQYDYCQKRIKQCQLEHLVDVQLCDYRDINGTFDHAISIEMIEAVGEKYWNSYFKTFKKVLKPEGRFAIQSIIISDKHFNNYRKNTDFIQQYIFPGGMLLSPQSLSKLFKKHHYTILDEIYFGLDYAKTLNIWKNNFNANLEKITELGFSEEFIRLWNFYLGYCEGAFAAKRIDVMQISGKV